MARSGSTPISTASRLGTALIMLAGGRRMEAMRTHGISESQAYKNLHDVVTAINKHPNLAIDSGPNSGLLAERAADFRSKSSHELFSHCVGAIDGLAIQIRAPNRKDSDNQLRFHSNSKKMYCINVQGVCDAKCRFIGFTAKHVGSINDSPAFETGKLRDINRALPFPMHWVGDNAYTSTETMMVPFPGNNLHFTAPQLEAFNFFQSQLRITIECTFGIFIQRWGIFWTPLKFGLPFCVELIHACIRLHNFCINRSIPIISSTYHPPAIAAVNEDGGLIDPAWHAGAEPNEVWAPANVVTDKM